MNETSRSAAPTMGLAEAARACNVSVATLRRRKDLLIQAGATITDKGYQIPIPALVSLGFLSSTTAPPGTAPAVTEEPDTAPPLETPMEPARNEVEILRRQLAEAETRAQVAEAIAAERERIIEAQSLALRMLERGTPGAPASNPVTESPVTPPVTPSVNLDPAPASAAVRPSAGRLRKLLGFRSAR